MYGQRQHATIDLGLYFRVSGGAHDAPTQSASAEVRWNAHHEQETHLQLPRGRAKFVPKYTPRAIQTDPNTGTLYFSLCSALTIGAIVLNFRAPGGFFQRLLNALLLP